MNESNKLSNQSCQDDSDPTSLSVEQARGRISNTVKPLGENEELPLLEVSGRVLAKAVISTIDVPPYDNSAMDGYAFCIQDLETSKTKPLRVIGSVFAGHPFEGNVDQGQCVRIMTGAAIPKGADTVIMQEYVDREGDSVRFTTTVKQGENVRRAGEDIRKGAAVLESGRRLKPADIGLLASLGIDKVTVKRRVRVALFSTGDELKELHEPLQEGQIHDSNRYTINALLQQLPVEIIDMGIIPDRQDAIREAFTQASKKCDAVVTSGGVSVGDADYIKGMLEELGEVGFWKIAMKPGRPLAFGRLDTAYFFGLPGNPVSAMVTYLQFVAPALRQLMGEPAHPNPLLRLRCRSKLKKRAGRTEFQRGKLVANEQGELEVASTGAQGSHILTSMSQADCFIILSNEMTTVEPGEYVNVELIPQT